MLIHVERTLGECRIHVCINGNPHGITALFGPSGAGKTSIINMVAGLLTPDSGVIRIGDHCLFDYAKGINLPPEQRHVGYVFQEARLFPHLSVRANLLYGHPHTRKKHQKSDLEHAISLLGISHLLERKPKTLSGGEKQRVALGRALLSFPKILLMDEPLAALDAERKNELLPYIKRLNTDYRLPVLYVSHSSEEVTALADKIVYIAKGEVTHFEQQP